jgi:hypothetical protein
MPSDPSGWPDEVREAVARAINEHDLDAPEWADADAEWHGILLAEADAVLVALAPFVAALAQARRDALEEAAQIVREHEAHIPTLKARDYPDDMGRLIDDIEAAIRAKAREAGDE